jgi:predicted CXXCH cytochrome family protein
VRVEARVVRRRAAVFAVVFLCGAIAAALYLASSRQRPVDDVPRVATESADALLAASYTGSATCGRCHAEQFRAWQSSPHALAMQVASDDTVLGDFSRTRFAYGGVTTEFFRRDGAFVIRTDGPDGKMADFELRHTFGIYPLQQYLLELPGGRLQALSIAWDARPREVGGQRWFHLYPGERIDHRDELHWTRRQQNWNYMCADCHSTNLQKNYDATADTYATSWSEISVGCESCHGPGSAHVELASEGRGGAGLSAALDERRGATWSIDPATGNARRTPARQSSRELDVCAQCHARRSQFSNAYRAGEPFLDHYRPALLESGLYHPDGQQREEVYDWGSFLSSRMHDAGVTCSDCHEPHATALRAPGSALCSQCHQPAKYQATSHHQHTLGSPGSQCVACHMPTTTYMVVDPRHDHSFRIPRPDLSVSIGVPNACNQCHQDRSADWAATAIRRAHPEPRPGFQTFGAAFAAADRGDRVGVRALNAMIGDSAQSAIARASALERLARQPDRAAVDTARASLADPSPLVRGAALAVLEVLPPLERRAALPLLDDPVRTVRLAAANLLAPLAADALGDHAASFERAAAEYIAAERFNADRPENRTNLGNFLAERGDAAAAEAEYRAALSLDENFVPAWVNLADLQRMQGNETEAEATLRAALEESPGNADLRHALGLALVRQQRVADAVVELAGASRAAPENQRFAYVYAIALHSQGRVREAIDELDRALAAAPGDPDILQALAQFLSETGDDKRAAEIRDRLQQLN